MWLNKSAPFCEVRVWRIDFIFRWNRRRSACHDEWADIIRVFDACLSFSTNGSQADDAIADLVGFMLNSTCCISGSNVAHDRILNAISHRVCNKAPITAFIELQKLTWTVSILFHLRKWLQNTQTCQQRWCASALCWETSTWLHVAEQSTVL